MTTNKLNSTKYFARIVLQLQQWKKVVHRRSSNVCRLVCVFPAAGCVTDSATVPTAATSVVSSFVNVTRRCTISERET